MSPNTRILFAGWNVAATSALPCVPPGNHSSGAGIGSAVETQGGTLTHAPARMN